MNRSSLFVLNLLLFSTACFGQTTPGDSQTLQALLSEVRQLRQDLQTTTIAGQRAQILIYRLQGQEAAVARASQRLDEARDKLARIEEQRQQVVTAIKRTEGLISNTDNPPTQRKELEDSLAQFKTRLESLSRTLFPVGLPHLASSRTGASLFTNHPAAFSINQRCVVRRRAAMGASGSGRRSFGHTLPLGPVRFADVQPRLHPECEPTRPLPMSAQQIASPEPARAALYQ